MNVRLLIITCFSALLCSCRGELPYLRAEGENVDSSPESSRHIKGMYLLNEGNMGSNKCSIDFLDCTTGEYFRNIYAQ